MLFSYLRNSGHPPLFKGGSAQKLCESGKGTSVVTSLWDDEVGDSAALLEDPWLSASLSPLSPQKTLNAGTHTPTPSHQQSRACFQLHLVTPRLELLGFKVPTESISHLLLVRRTRPPNCPMFQPHLLPASRYPYCLLSLSGSEGLISLLLVRFSSRRCGTEGRKLNLV